MYRRFGKEYYAMDKKNILLILTGGTICSFATDKGEQASDTSKAQALIVHNFKNGTSPYRDNVDFHCVSPLDILSENMTVTHWDSLIKAIKSYDLSRYDGAIILHGTDTLAYTAALLSVLLAGTPVPVIMVSSQLPIYNKKANGNANFKAAVELIVNGIQPNVYAVYLNKKFFGLQPEHTMYIHYAAHLIQCGRDSNNFHSKTMRSISSENAVFEGKKCHRSEMLIHSEKFNELNACVLKIEPYTGIDYSKYSLEGVDAVLHGTYHSYTIPTDTADEKNSILFLKELCDKHSPKIPLFIEPCPKTIYETTGTALRNGIIPISGLTSEMAYTKTVIGCSIGLSGAELIDFINTDINDEFLN